MTRNESPTWDVHRLHLIGMVIVCIVLAAMLGTLLWLVLR